MRVKVDMADVGIVEMVEGGRAFKARDKLTVEEYVNFIDSRKQLNLTVGHLREIIYMHGFRKLTGTSKETLLEAVASMELMDPGHSTLQDNSVSSYVHLTVKEVIKDLADLKWQECCVTSLQTINGANCESSQPQPQPQRPEAPAPVNPKGGKKKKPKTSSTLQSTSQVTTDDIAVESTGNDSVGEFRGEKLSSCSSVTTDAGGSGNSEPQLMQKRKRHPKGKRC